MICFNCGAECADSEICNVCGAHQNAYRMIINASNAAYNEGLRRAQVRDLTGAIEMLSKSLHLNKYNTEARNLLGLVYFEVGQTVRALREWVISKNLGTEDNPVDYYLGKVQQRGIINSLNSMTQKYNLALQHCRDGNYDMARIQLKRVVSANPKMVEANQLLALLMIRNNKYKDARKALIAAAKVDYKNPITMVYMQEVKDGLKDTQKKRKRKRRNTVDLVDGNDTVIIPRRSVFEMMDIGGSGVINVLVGCLVGVLVAVFLVVPTMKRAANSDAQNAVVTASQEAANSANNVASLEKEVEKLHKELDKYTGMGDVKTSYEKLIEAKTAIDEEDVDTAAKAMKVVNKEILNKKGKKLYTEVNTIIKEQQTTDAYDNGVSAFRRSNYSEAIKQFKIVIKIDKNYKDGEALSYLAQSYEKNEDYKNAKKYYQMISREYPNSYKQRKADYRLRQIEAKEEESE